MSDCSGARRSYGEVVAKLNEDNRKLRVVCREMYQILLMMPSSWEDETHHIKHYKDRLTALGVDVGRCLND